MLRRIRDGHTKYTLLLEAFRHTGPDRSDKEMRACLKSRYQDLVEEYGSSILHPSDSLISMARVAVREAAEDKQRSQDAWSAIHYRDAAELKQTIALLQQTIDSHVQTIQQLEQIKPTLAVKVLEATTEHIYTTAQLKAVHHLLGSFKGDVYKAIAMIEAIVE